MVGLSSRRLVRYAVLMKNRESDPLRNLKWPGSTVRQLAFMGLAVLAVLAGFVWVATLTLSGELPSQITIFTIAGSAFALIGSAGQAFDELRRSMRAYLQIRPSQYKKLGIPEQDARSKFQKDLMKAVIDPLRKARNWLWILGGSILVLAASIGDAINH